MPTSKKSSSKEEPKESDVEALVERGKKETDEIDRNVTKYEEYRKGRRTTRTAALATTNSVEH